MFTLHSSLLLSVGKYQKWKKPTKPKQHNDPSHPCRKLCIPKQVFGFSAWVGDCSVMSDPRAQQTGRRELVGLPTSHLPHAPWCTGVSLGCRARRLHPHTSTHQFVLFPVKGAELNPWCLLFYRGFLLTWGYSRDALCKLYGTDAAFQRTQNLLALYFENRLVGKMLSARIPVFFCNKMFFKLWQQSVDSKENIIY